MSGYGLFGVLTELDLDMQPNVLLTPRFHEMAGLEVGRGFANQLASDSTIQMGYGRMMCPWSEAPRRAAERGRSDSARRVRSV